VIVGIEDCATGDRLFDCRVKFIAVDHRQKLLPRAAARLLIQTQSALADSTASRVHPLAGVFVFLFSADVGFFGASTSTGQHPPLDCKTPATDVPLNQAELLRDSNFLSQLHGGNALAGKWSSWYIA